LSKVGDYIIKQIREKMEYHKRIATGESVERLREEYRKGHILIYGVDYWDAINNGTPKGTLVSLDDIQRWITAKGARYGGTFPPATAIQRKIYAKGSSVPKKDLNIISKATSDVKQIARLAKDVVLRELKAA